MKILYFSAAAAPLRRAFGRAAAALCGCVALLCLAGVAILCLTGCGRDEGDDSGRIVVFSGLPPVAYIASQVGGDHIVSYSMLPEGRNPHDYSPGPQEVRRAATARLFFITGMEYERAVSRPLQSGKTRIIDISAGVNRIAFDGAETEVGHQHTDSADHAGHGDHCDHADHSDHAGHAHAVAASAGVEASGDCCAHNHDHGDAWDPHVWLSAENVRIMADNIAAALGRTDPEHRDEYLANAAAFKQRMDETEAYVMQQLEPFAGREFYVYHPAFGYFADMTGLRQVAIEAGGREMTPKQLSEVIRRAREQKVTVIFVQPQFNPTSSRALANAINGKVAGLDALASDIPSNMRAMADALREGFTTRAAGADNAGEE